MKYSSKISSFKGGEILPPFKDLEIWAGFFGGGQDKWPRETGF
jgi:hypothetical protein